MLQVVIPMAGTGSRFTKYGFKVNKYLLPINKTLSSMIEQAILSLNISVESVYIFILRKQDDTNAVTQILTEICTKNNLNFKIVMIDNMTEGPACTVYEAFEHLNMDDELIVSNSDQVLDWDFTKFINTSRNYDGSVLTYKPDYEIVINSIDKHSFIRFDNTGKIDKFAEKIALSDKALVGVHYFKKAKNFIEGYNKMVKDNLRAPNGEFYLSLVYQSLLEQNYSIGYDDIKGTFYPVGEPNDYFNYLYNNAEYSHDIVNISNITNHIIVTNQLFTITIHNVKENVVVINNGLIVLLSGNAEIDNKGVITSNNITKSNIKTLSACMYLNITYNGLYEIIDKDVWNLEDFVRGWFIGNFMPSIIRTIDFEVGRLIHKKNEKWPFHYHRYMDEINILLKGSMLLNERLLKVNDIFTIHKNEIACPVFLEECYILCIKVPSVIGDKECI